MIDRDLPLKKVISENIQRLMNKRGWKQIHLSEASGISKSTLSDYINHKTLINPGNVQKIADAFGVQKSEIDPSFKKPNGQRYFLVADPQAEYTTKVGGVIINDTQLLPIVGTISCGNGVIAYEDIEGYEEIPKSWIKGAEHFLLRAKGDSMINARIEDGDILLIRQQGTFENGEIMAVLLNDEAVLKRIYKIDGQIMLQSENSKYPPKFISSQTDIRIIGKLKMNLINY